MGNGLAALRTLRLKGEPALKTNDTSGKTIATDVRLLQLWSYAFRRALGVPVEQVDAPRIRKAFADCLGSLVEWPQPRIVIDMMPRRPHRHQLPAPVSQQDREQGLIECRKIIQSLKRGAA